jgi:putative methionine-R-sulfoxide reductase with GAF domain
MFELVARSLVLAAVLAASLAVGRPAWPVAWQAGAVWAVVGYLSWTLERRGLKNEGSAGWIAVLDSVFVSVALASSGLIDRFGFLALAPLVWAVGSAGASAAAMAPLTVAGMLASANSLTATGWTPALLGQALGVLTVGLLAHQRQKVVTVTEVVEAPVAAPVEAVPEDYLELRENYRSLRDHVRAVEDRAKSDRLGAELARMIDADDPDLPSQIAQRARAVCGADGLALFVRPVGGDACVAFATDGDVPTAAKDAAFDLRAAQNESQLLAQIELALQPTGDHRSVAVEVLRLDGQTVGLACVFARQQTRLSEAWAAMRSVAEDLAASLARMATRSAERRRLTQAETLYAVASVAAGAESPASLAARVVREIAEAVSVDHLSIHRLDGRESVLLAQHGKPMRPVEEMSFAAGPGIEGWLAIGAPELVMTDARQDQRLPGEVALKRRIGSLVVVPLPGGEEPMGFLVAACHRMRGLDDRDVDALRTVAAETALALERLEGGANGPQGLATPGEFARHLQAAGPGSLVYLEVVRAEELRERFGAPALDHAVRGLARRLRARLTQGGLLCRRSEGDYVAFLPGAEDDAARAWANEATTMAAMLAMPTPDGRSSVPLALRAKVAEVNRQSDRISQESAA